MKQLVSVKCHISIYILEKGILVKFEPLERNNANFYLYIIASL